MRPSNIVLTIICLTVIIVSSFYIGTAYEKWRTTDRVETFDKATNRCADIIIHDGYIKTHPEVNRGMLLDDCVKYVMKEGAN